MPFLGSVEGTFSMGRNTPQTPVVTSNLQIWVDAGNNASYPGSGTKWSNLVNSNAGTYWYNLSNSPSVSTIVYNATSNVSLTFDGVNDYATPNTSLSTLAQANSWKETREYWLYWPGLPGCLTMESGVASPDVSWFDAQVGLSNTSLAYAVWSDMTAKVITNSFTANKWNHIIWQHDKSANLMMGYVNGIMLYSNASVPRTTPDSAGYGFYPILMARSATNFGYGSGSYLGASLGVFRWYNQILTSAQISSNFNGERGRFGI